MRFKCLQCDESVDVGNAVIHAARHVERDLEQLPAQVRAEIVSHYCRDCGRVDDEHTEDCASR